MVLVCEVIATEVQLWLQPLLFTFIIHVSNILDCQEPAVLGWVLASCLVIMIVVCTIEGNGLSAKDIHILGKGVKEILSHLVLQCIVICSWSAILCPGPLYSIPARNYLVLKHPSKGDWIFAWNSGLPQIWVMVIIKSAYAFESISFP